MNYLLFTKSNYFLARLPKIDEKTTTKVLDKKKHDGNKIYCIIIKIKYTKFK